MHILDGPVALGSFARLKDDKAPIFSSRGVVQKLDSPSRRNVGCPTKNEHVLDAASLVKLNHGLLGLRRAELRARPILSHTRHDHFNGHWAEKLLLERDDPKFAARLASL